MSGRRWPAEWEPHEATWIVWPWDASIWGPHHEGAQRAIAASIAALSHHERVDVLVPSAAWSFAVRERVERHGGRADAVRIACAPSDDVWVRDAGPTVIFEDARRRCIDWNFDAWGGKFPHAHDAGAAERLASAAGLERERAPFTFEGGAIEGDGAGTVLCTRSVARARGAGGVDAVEGALCALLGAERVVWLERGMGSDDTDGHVDTLARFAPSGAILAHAAASSSHPDADALEANLATLRGVFEEVVPLPAGVLEVDGEVRPASYANFYVANGLVLVPQYGLATDADALALVAAHHPGWRAVPIPCRALVTQGGAIHCATQQLPVPPRSAR